MSEPGQKRRQRIIEKANRLFYMQGYNQTSFAHIADAVGITKGNLHYHFNSKEELLRAIVDYRKHAISQLLNSWDQAFSTPGERLHRFVQMLVNDQQHLARFGCPMGTLNLELGKNQPELQQAARAMFEMFEQYLESQFLQLGADNARDMAFHLLAMAQGAALMAYVHGDATLLAQECQKIDDWIDTLLA